MCESLLRTRLPERGPALSSRERTLLVAVFVLYCAVVSFGATVHEPWWDEGQAWLLARDASIGDLLSRHLSYEGHPPLWYLLLAIPAKLGLPYASLKVVAGLAGATGVLLLLFRLRFVPLAIRALTPFSFYLAYQYTVVARSYVLVGALLLAIATIYDKRAHRFGTFGLLLAILAGVSVHGIALATALAVLFAADVWRGRILMAPVPPWRRAAISLAFSLWLAALMIIVWPAADLTSRGDLHSPLDPRRWLAVLQWLVPELLWGDVSEYGQAAARAVFCAVLAGSAVLLVWLAHRGFLGGFLLLNASLLSVSAIYYSSWHEGLFFLATLFSVVVAYGRGRQSLKLDRLVLATLLVILLRHLQWTAESLRYDARNEFTGSESAARFIRENGIDRRTVFGMGVRSLELQPHFDSNLYANYRLSGSAFWDWSASNRWPYPRPTAESVREMRNWYVGTIAQDPDYVLCAIGFRRDHLYARAMQENHDYRLVRTFEGRTFWKSEPVELIAFQLFERVAP